MMLANFITIVILVFGANKVRSSKNEFDVLSITNVAAEYVATVNVAYDQDIPEFTVCYRFLISAYNNFWVWILNSKDEKGYFETIGFQTGLEDEGYQSTMYVLYRNIPGGGLGTRAFPYMHHNLLPKNVQTSKWCNSCTSYSSTLHQIHMYHDGLKVFSYNYTDEKEDPLASNLFDHLRIARNFRGQFTDLNIYSTFFPDNKMISWTTNCDQPPGQIFSWVRDKITLLDVEADVKFIKLGKSEVCSEPDKIATKQEPSKLGGTDQTKRFKPKQKDRSSYDGKVLELISDPYAKDNYESTDKCFRLAGEIMSVPLNDEEEELMDKIMWDYQMKKAANNLTFLIEKGKFVDAHLGGETKTYDLKELFPNLERMAETREALYPRNGYFKYYNSVTGEHIKPGKVMVQLHNSYTSIAPQCVFCFSSPKVPNPEHVFFKDPIPICIQTMCTSRRTNSGMICVFDKEPAFNIRGLCEEAVMDTQYKLADFKPMNQSEELRAEMWGNDDTRSYVGPKGWTITRNVFDKKWQMNHTHYPELTLTMLDMDALPLGRHNWRIENNVCTQGETSTQVLLMSGCKEAEFTCDDGKCLNITQRCNNIEVEFVFSINLLPFISRIVMM